MSDSTDWHWFDAGADVSESIKDALVVLFVFDGDLVRPIGTGFFTHVQGSEAVVLTAAHCLEQIWTLQNPTHRRLATALEEFLPPRNPIDLGSSLIRAFMLARGEPVECRITWAMSSKSQDIAIIRLRSEHPFPAHSAQFEVTDRMPKAGDFVGVSGYSRFEVEGAKSSVEGAISTQIKHQTLTRVGRVLDVHAEGHLLCKGPCIEASMPVFGGMSGGPAFFLEEGSCEVQVFGLVCADMDVDCSDSKNDPMVIGRTTIALLCLESLEPGQMRLNLHGAEVHPTPIVAV